MRQLIVAMVLFAGCASTDAYRPGPPTTVPPPTYDGPIVSPNRPAGVVIPSGSAAPYQPAPEYIESPWTRFMNWLRSGRGWTWGAASRGPIRDEGLDRLMMDTLTNSRPERSQEPVAPAPIVPYPTETWLYPQAPAVQGDRSNIDPGNFSPDPLNGR